MSYFVQAFIISLNSHTTQDALEVFCRGAAVPTEGSEEVSGHVTHSEMNKFEKKIYIFKQIKKIPLHKPQMN